MTDTIEVRLNDHSKRLQKLEQAYVQNDLEQREISRKLTRITEVLFGSDDPSEVSIKDQLRELSGLVKHMTTEFATSQKDTAQIRTDGFARIEKLEAWQKEEKEKTKENTRDWKQFAMQGLFWIITVIISMLIGQYFI